MPVSPTTGFSVLVVLGGVLLIHEAGHYVAGGVAGVPAKDRRMQLFAAPPHVAIRGAGGWASPFNHDHFSAAWAHHDPDNEYGPLFTAGGFLAQTIVVAPAGFGIGLMAPDLGLTVLSTSLYFVVAYLVLDVIASVIAGRPMGDTTHLYRLDPISAVGMLAVFFLIHIGGIAVLPG